MERIECLLNACARIGCKRSMPQLAASCCPNLQPSHPESCLLACQVSAAISGRCMLLFAGACLLGSAACSLQSINCLHSRMNSAQQPTGTLPWPCPHAGAPTNPTYIGGVGKVTVLWESPVTNPDPATTKYRLYATPNTSGRRRHLLGGGQTSFIELTPTSGTGTAAQPFNATAYLPGGRLWGMYVSSSGPQLSWVA